MYNVVFERRLLRLTVYLVKGKFNIDQFFSVSELEAGSQCRKYN